MSQIHTAEVVLDGSIQSALRQAQTASLIADADFATDEATTLANIDTRNAHVHPTLVPLYHSTKRAVAEGFRQLGSTVMTGGSISSILTAASTQTWAPGFAVTL